MKTLIAMLFAALAASSVYAADDCAAKAAAVSYTHLTLPTNREV